MPPITPLSNFAVPVPAAPPPPPPEPMRVQIEGSAPLDVHVLTMPAVTVPPLEFPGSLAVTGPVTDAQLRATAVPVSLATLPALVAGSATIGNVGIIGTVPVSGTFYQATQPVSGPVTDAQLRATAVPVSLATLPALVAGSATIGNVGIIGTVPVSGTFYQATQPVSGPVTDAQLRATAVPVQTTPKKLETWIWSLPTQAGGANKILWQFFNASGSGKIVKLVGIYPIVDTDTAVTGLVGIELHALMTSTNTVLGAGSNWSASPSYNANSVMPCDSTNAALPSQITGYLTPTGTAANDTGIIASMFVPGEEASGSMAYMFSGQTNMLATLECDESQRVTLREGKGIKFCQGSIASVGNLRFRVVFTVE